MANVYTCKKCSFETYHPELICQSCGDSYPDMEVRDDGVELEAIVSTVAEEAAENEDEISENNFVAALICPECGRDHGEHYPSCPRYDG